MTDIKNIFEEIEKKERDTLAILDEKKKELEHILGIANEEEFKKLGKNLPKNREQAVEEKKWLDPQEEYQKVLEQIKEIQTRENQTKYN